MSSDSRSSQPAERTRHPRLKARLLSLLLLALVLAACDMSRRGQRLEDIPTLANVDALATSVIQTENAPPEGFRGPVSFPLVDQNLEELAGWHYVVRLEFSGTFSDVARETSASANAEVWYNQLGSARRVVVSTSGELLGSDESIAYEAVRLGPDAYLVEDGVCLANAGADAEVAAGLTAACDRHDDVLDALVHDGDRHGRCGHR